MYEYVPQLCANLLSVRQLTANGNKVMLELNTCKIINGDDVIIAITNLCKNLHRLDCVACRRHYLQKMLLTCGTDV